MVVGYVAVGAGRWLVSACFLSAPNPQCNVPRAAPPLADGVKEYKHDPLSD